MKKTLIFLICISWTFAENYSFSWKEGRVNIDTDTLKISYKTQEKNYEISSAQEKKDSKLINKGKSSLKFNRKGEVYEIGIKDDRIEVVYNEGLFPSVADSSSNFLYLPLGQGKKIPVKDKDFIEYYDGSKEKGSEFFSMSFFANVYNDIAFTYIFDNITNNKINFYKNKDILAMNLTHGKAGFAKENRIKFEVSLTSTSPYDVAEEYRTYIKKNRKVRTLEMKAKENKNVEKLFGANHFYLWGSGLTMGNVHNYKVFIKKFLENYLNNAQIERELVDFFEDNIEEIEDGRSILKDFKNLSKEKEFYQYQLRNLLNLINEAMLYSKDYKKTALKFQGKYKKYIDSFDEWGEGYSIKLISDMYNSGIKNAWLGLEDATVGEMGIDVTKYANQLGYLTGPYDSYHSVHKPGYARWKTANFKDKSLYYNNAIVGKDGKYLTGFLGRGRKLNPKYSFDSVRYRLEKNKNLGFNSWFIDCDGTGDIYDDYSKKTTEKDGYMNRLKRMEIIEKEFDKVIGTEGGNDYSASTVAFAHGLAMPLFGWGDNEMRKDKSSKYYVGDYYSPTGGIPTKYSKEVEIKEKYKKLIYDNKYNLPLYQIVYNNIIITSNHWEFDTLKAKNYVKALMLRGLLYNSPPMYHLDQKRWSKYKNLIVKYNKVFNPIHKRLIKEEIVSFEFLDTDGQLQKTRYSDGTEVIVNFSKEKKAYNKKVLEGETALITTDDEVIYF